MPFSFPKRLFFHNLSATYSFGRRIKGRAADFISATRPLCADCQAARKRLQTARITRIMGRARPGGPACAPSLRVRAFAGLLRLIRRNIMLRPCGRDTVFRLRGEGAVRRFCGGLRLTAFGAPAAQIHDQHNHRGQHGEHEQHGQHVDHREQDILSRIAEAAPAIREGGAKLLAERLGRFR